MKNNTYLIVNDSSLSFNYLPLFAFDETEINEPLIHSVLVQIS